MRWSRYAAPILIIAVFLAALYWATRPANSQDYRPTELTTRSLNDLSLRVHKYVSGPAFPRVTRVIDGDTFETFDTPEPLRVRIYNIDTPELKGQCPAERAQALRAKEFLASLIDGKRLYIEGLRRDRYDRMIAKVFLVQADENVDVGELMIKQGLARKWRGKREKWCG